MNSDDQKWDRAIDDANLGIVRRRLMLRGFHELKAAGDPWEEAMADIAKGIARLRLAAKTLRRRRDAGEPWPA